MGWEPPIAEGRLNYSATQRRSVAAGLLVRSSRAGYGFKWVANFCSCFEQPIFYTFAAWVLRILIGGEEKNIIVYQFARIFFMVICRVVECGGMRGNGIFFPNSGVIDGWGRMGILVGAMPEFRMALFFGGDIRVAAYRIAMEGTQKLRYFASA